jgi:transcriptional regulator with XRE-family HTH domain
VDQWPWARVAEQVKVRREDLGLTQRQVAIAAGTTDRYISAIERAERDTYQQKTLRAIARALGWQSGSIDLILAGGDPVPAAEVTATRTIEERVTALEAELAELWALVETSVVRHDPELLDQLSRREGRRPAGAGRQRAG